jgi:hypothetical protein
VWSNKAEIAKVTVKIVADRLNCFQPDHFWSSVEQVGDGLTVYLESGAL